MVGNTTRGPCTPETRTDVLQNLAAWCNRSDTSLYWMIGMVGTGKTTIAYTLCEMLEKANLLGGSFFCSRLLPNCTDIKLIFPTIAFQLARLYAPFGKALADVLHHDADILQRTLEVQLRKLLIEPWAAEKEQLPTHTIIVLDALDECEEHPTKFLRALLDHATILPFKVLMTSRPELSIRDTITRQDPSIISTFILHEVESDIIQADIAKYLKSQLSHRTTPDMIHLLTQLSTPLFIYAATLARIFVAGGVDIDARIQMLQVSSPNLDKSKMMASLDHLYEGVLENVFSDHLIETEVGEIKDFLYTIVCAREPLTRRCMAELWDVREEIVDRRLESLHSVISVPRGAEDLITVFHASFTDFMLDHMRSGKFCCQLHTFNLRLAKQCFVLMKHELYQNICHLDRKQPNDSLDLDTIHKHVSLGLRYAIVYWSEHWMLSDRSERQIALGLVHEFVTTHVLQWFECLSLTRRLASSIQSLEMLLDTASIDENLDLANLVYDSLRFIQLVYDPVNYSAVQVYFYALTWIPSRSPLRIYYSALCDQAPRALCGLAPNWTGPDQVIDIRSVEVSSVAVSQDGRWIVCGSNDGTVRIWNVHSHLEKCVLTGHTRHVHSVAISEDGGRVVSGSWNGPIQVWDTTTYTAVLTIKVSGLLWAVTLSLDGRWIASGHSDGFVRVWNAINGHLIHSLQGHTNYVRSVAFMSDSTRLVSASADGTVRIWNVTIERTERIFPVHTSLLSMACSPEGDKIIMGSDDNTARLWHISGRELQVLRAHSDRVSSVAFMPDGKRVITGSSDRTIRAWNATSGNAFRLFTGLAQAVRSIAVFPNGLKIASSSGRTISLWSLRSPVSAAGEEKKTGTSAPAVEADSMAFSPDGRRVLLLPSLSVLDTENLEERAALSSKNTRHKYGAFSTPGNKVAATAGAVIEVWELTNMDVVGNHVTIEGHIGDINSVSFSHHDYQLVSASDDHTARIWDVASGKSIRILIHPACVNSTVFSHDDGLLISATECSVHVWIPRSGEELYHFDTDAHSITFSPDDRHIIKSYDNIIELWNSQTCQLERTYEGYSYWTILDDGSSYALSEDNQWIYYTPLSEQPRRLVWIPLQYRPSLSVEFFNGPLFTATSRGVRVCLPRDDGLVTLMIPSDN